MGSFKRGTTKPQLDQQVPTKWSKPKSVSKADLALGPHDMEEFLPSWDEIPSEFKGRLGCSKGWLGFISGWFFSSLSKPRVEALKAKPGIDKIQALSHVKSIMGSFAPKPEHKEAGCAYLMSLWFEGPT